MDAKNLTSDQSHLSNQLVHGQIHSTRDGKCFHASNLHDLLKEIVHDILIEPLKWNDVVAELIARTRSLRCDEIEIVPFASPKACKHLAESLRATGVTVNIKNTDGDRSATFDHHRSGDIAVVGMGGRFPGSEDLEGFWKTLMDGLDLHKQVCCSHYSHRSSHFHRFFFTDTK